MAGGVDQLARGLASEGQAVAGADDLGVWQREEVAQVGEATAEAEDADAELLHGGGRYRLWDQALARRSMLRCMRATLTLDHEAAVLLKRARKDRNLSLQGVVNEALRQGLRAMTAPRKRRVFSSVGGYAESKSAAVISSGETTTSR